MTATEREKAVPSEFFEFFNDCHEPSQTCRRYPEQGLIEGLLL